MLRLRSDSALVFAATCLGCLAVNCVSGGLEDPDTARELTESLGSTSFTVFPPIVRGAGADSRAATEIADFLRSEGFGEAIVAPSGISVPSQYSANELVLLRETATLFSDFLVQNGLDTDWAILTDYVMGGASGAQCIHVYVFAGDGTIAYARAYNQTSESFRLASPSTTPECTRFAIERLRNRLGGSAR
ncbi:hypothetical protein JW921_06320 [Candidatus Fermentibacterales bacterium]|nr:hypothetical protein [Candidatus Fermentibacterales bacterium]